MKNVTGHVDVGRSGPVKARANRSKGHGADHPAARSGHIKFRRSKFLRRVLASGSLHSAELILRFSRLRTLLLAKQNYSQILLAS